MATVDLLPGGLDAKFRTGNAQTLELTWPAGVLDGRTFTAEIDTDPVGTLNVDVDGDTMVITLDADTSELVTEPTEWRLLEGDQVLIVGRWRPSPFGSPTPGRTVTVRIGTASVAVAANAPGDPIGTADDLVDEEAAARTAADLLLIPKATLDAQTILGATADNTPLAIAIGASRLFGRKATGDIGPLTPAEVLTILAAYTSAQTDSAIANAIAALVDSSPGTLDTLNELAAALGDDPNFATTITNALALKAALASPAFTGTPTAPTAALGTNTTQIATTAHVHSEVLALQAQAARIVAEGHADVTVSNSAVETTLATLATPAGLAAGDRLILRAAGNLLNNTAATTHTPRIKIGATTLVTGSAALFTQNATRRKWYLEMEIVLVSTASQRASGYMMVGAASAADMAMATGQNSAIAYGVATEDLTTTKDVLLTMQMSAADPAADFVVRHASLEYIRKAA